MAIVEFTNQLLSHMGVDRATVELQNKDDAIFIVISLPEEESGMLIGRGGQTLDALQRVSRLLFQKDLEKPIVVTVNDYVERRREYLTDLALRSAEVVESTGVQKVFRFPSYERRIIHMALAEHAGVESVSVGEGDERILTIRKKQGTLDQ